MTILSYLRNEVYIISFVFFFNIFLMNLFNISTFTTFNTNAITMIGNFNTHNPASTFISALSTSVLSLIILCFLLGTTFPRLTAIAFLFSVTLWMHSLQNENSSMLQGLTVSMPSSFAFLILTETMTFGTLLTCSFAITASAGNGIHTVVSSLARTPFVLTLILCMLGVAMCFNMYYFLFFHRTPSAAGFIITLMIVAFLALSASEYTTVPLYYNTHYASLLAFTVVSIHLSHVLLCLSLYMLIELLPTLPLLFPVILFILGKQGIRLIIFGSAWHFL